MAYAIISIEKLKTYGNISSSTSHNNRTIPAKNCDPTKTHLNELSGLAGQPNQELLDHIQERIKKASRKPRPDAVLMLDIVLSASSEFFETATPEQLQDWKKSGLKFAQDKFGAENVVASWLHLDEKTPHLHIFVIPMVETQHINHKTKKVSMDLTLNASHYIDGKKRCADFHTDYAKSVAHLGIERGREFSPDKKTSVKDFQKDMQAKQAEIDKKNIELDQLKAQLTHQTDAANFRHGQVKQLQEQAQKDRIMVAELLKAQTDAAEKFETERLAAKQSFDKYHHIAKVVAPLAAMAATVELAPILNKLLKDPSFRSACQHLDQNPEQVDSVNAHNQAGLVSAGTNEFYFGDKSSQDTLTQHLQKSTKGYERTFSNEFTF